MSQLHLVIYLDCNATTRPRPEVVEALLPYLGERFGNASSVHRRGQAAKAALETARESVGRSLGAEHAREVVFTSGGTEGDYLALRGALRARPERRHVIVSAIEHEAVLNTARALATEGCEVDLAPVDAHGVVRLDALERLLRPDTCIVSVMWANNETGVVQPLERIGALAHAVGAIFHSDAVQALGKLPLRVAALPLDLLSVSAHKIEGPQGVGALWIRTAAPWLAPLQGGGQERGRRPGTHHLAGIVGFARACDLATAELAEKTARWTELRDRLERGLLRSLPGVTVHGALAERVANTSFVSFSGVDGEAVLMLLDEYGVCVSTGSACTAGDDAPSHVLLAAGVPEALARASVRYSIGRETTAEQIDETIERTAEIVEHLRALAPPGLEVLTP
ncbi:MAG: cysteine desulfurase [Planctomycetes bacterium]|nr:cysteine desulfurase [Planctomycetota bacterium]